MEYRIKENTRDIQFIEELKDKNSNNSIHSNDYY
jgi:hypothetical protein